jgi:hypothetical protein
LRITLERIRRLVQEGAVGVSEHGYDELSADAIFACEVIVGIADAILEEDYPEYPKGPCVLSPSCFEAANTLI